MVDHFSSGLLIKNENGGGEFNLEFFKIMFKVDMDLVN